MAEGPRSDRQQARQQRREEIRDARREAERRACRADLRRAFRIVGIVVIVAVAIGGVAFYGSLLFPTPEPIGELQLDLGQAHVEQLSPIEFSQYPPTSGPHYPQPASPGVYVENVAEGFWIHSLEHGYVVVLYQCGADCARIQDNLRTLLADLPRSPVGYVKLVATPNDRIEKPIVLTAWNYVLELDQYDEAQIRAFYESHVDRGPEPNAG